MYLFRTYFSRVDLYRGIRRNRRLLQSVRFRKLFPVSVSCQTSYSFLLRDKFHCNGQISSQYFVYGVFYSYNIRFFRTGLQRKIQLAFLRSIWADIARPHPKRLTIVLFMTCSVVCMGGYSCLLWSLSDGCSIVILFLF